jgi:hypothetical protein
VATVMRKEIDLGNLTGGFIGAIKNGFGLNWKPLQECGTCESSGGNCGYNSTREDAKLLCFCKEGSISGEGCKGMLSTALTSGFFFFFFFFFFNFFLKNFYFFFFFFFWGV